MCSSYEYDYQVMNIIIARLLVYLIIVVPLLTLYSCTKPSVIVKIRLGVHLSTVNDPMYGFAEILFFHCATTSKLSDLHPQQRKIVDFLLNRGDSQIPYIIS